MALVLADRVKETTTTAGTGTITLAGASTGFQSFAAIGDANSTYYTIVAQTGTEWEVGIGTYTSSGTTLSRTTVLSSSNSGSLVNFSAGTKDVFVTYPSGKGVWLDAAGKFVQTTFTDLSATGTITGALSGNATTATTATNVAGGAANRIVYNTAASTTGYAVAPTVASTLLNWNGSAFTWVSAATAIGYTPVQQGGGTGQGANKLYIGWLGSNLGLQVDSTNFSSTWPISVTGSAVNVAGGVANQIPYQTGVATTSFIANGTTGQVLTATTGSAPTFQTSTAASKAYVQAIGILRGL
jgi:hypothetical protein